MAAPVELQSFVYEHRCWAADPRELAPIRAEVRCWLDSAGLDAELVDDLVMAVSEAVTNGVEHAYQPTTGSSTVELTFLLDQGDIDIEIVDHGRWRPPSTDRAGRGRGIALIQRVIDSVIIHFGPTGTRVALHHRVPARIRAVGSRVERHHLGGADDDERRVSVGH